MKYFLLILLIVVASGCTHYANIERIQLGITTEDLMQIETPCYYRGSKDEKVLYNCKFRVSSSEYQSGRSVKPYILTFENNILTEINLDEHELDRQRIRDWYYGPGYYPYGDPYPYYRFHYGYPLWYP